jgi:hypothetical protein
MGSGKINRNIKTANATIVTNKFKFNTTYMLNSFKYHLKLHQVFDSRKKQLVECAIYVMSLVN